MAEGADGLLAHHGAQQAGFEELPLRPGVAVRRGLGEEPGRQGGGQKVLPRPVLKLHGQLAQRPVPARHNGAAQGQRRPQPEGAQGLHVEAGEAQPLRLPALPHRLPVQLPLRQAGQAAVECLNLRAVLALQGLAQRLEPPPGLLGQHGLRVGLHPVQCLLKQSGGDAAGRPGGDALQQLQQLVRVLFGLLCQIGLPLRYVQPGQGLVGQIPGGPLPLRPAQLQQRGPVGRVAAQGGDEGQADLLFRPGQLRREEAAGPGPGRPLHDLHPPGHGPAAGGVKARLQQGEDVRPLPGQDGGVQIGQLPVAVPQSGDQGGEHPVVVKVLRVGLEGLLHRRHPPAARAGQGLQQGPELAVGHLPAGACAGGQGLQRPGHTRRRLGVRHRVHQGQHVQQRAAPLLRRCGQQSVQPGADFGKHGAGGGQGGQPLPGPPQAEILA